MNIKVSLEVELVRLILCKYLRKSVYNEHIAETKKKKKKNGCKDIDQVIIAIYHIYLQV